MGTIGPAAALGFDGGVGGLGKTKPETGVEFFDETAAPIQSDQGLVAAEIRGKDGSPILVSFESPWPLLPTSGTLETRDVNARFVNGKPEAIESIYIMKSPEAWDRFMRFMERYGESNGLVFTKAN